MADVSAGVGVQPVLQAGELVDVLGRHAVPVVHGKRLHVLRQLLGGVRAGVGDRVGIVVVAVEKDDPLESRGGKGDAQVFDQRHERRDPDVHEAFESDVRIRERVVDRRRHHRADPRRDPPRNLLRDEDVGQQRRMRSVLLGRADRDDDRVVRLAGRLRLPGSSSRRETRSPASSERTLAEVDALGDLGHPVGASGDRVSNSIVAWIGHLLSRISLQHFLDRRVPLPEWHVRSLVHLPILDVDVRDAIVMLLEERDRRRVVAGDEMADVEVGAVVLRVAERRLPIGRSGLRVAVVADHQLVLVGELAEALGVLGR